MVAAWEAAVVMVAVVAVVDNLVSYVDDQGVPWNLQTLFCHQQLN